MRQTLIHSNNNPAQSGARGIEQHQIIEILAGSQHIDLKSFFDGDKGAPGAIEVLPSIPGGSISSPQQMGAQVEQELLLKKKKRIALFVFLMIFLIASFAAISFFLGRYTEASRPASTLWRAIEVKDDAVVIALGRGADERLITIPKGARLPDGQRLLAVNSQRQIYSTEQQDVRVRRTTAGLP